MLVPGPQEGCMKPPWLPRAGLRIRTLPPPPLFPHVMNSQPQYSLFRVADVRYESE
jgi:hypothetical protein